VQRVIGGDELGTVTMNALSDKLVEAVKMPFQDALSHGRWCSAPRVGRGDVQGRSAADLTRRGLVCSKSGSNRRCHNSRRRGRWFGWRRRPIHVGLEGTLWKKKDQTMILHQMCRYDRPQRTRRERGDVGHLHHAPAAPR
jgi:hypothetical protein